MNFAKGMESVTCELVYKYIKIHLLKTGFVPTYVEIGEGVGLYSKASVFYHMRKLEEAGLIEYNEGRKQYRLTKGYWVIEE